MKYVDPGIPADGSRRRRCRPTHARFSVRRRGIDLAPVAIEPGEVSLNLWTSQLGVDTMVTIEGDVDLATTPRLVEQLADAFRLGGSGTRLLLDVTGIRFIDSAGAHGLEEIRALVEAAGADGMTFVGHSPPLMHLLGLLDLLPRFGFADGPAG